MHRHERYTQAKNNMDFSAHTTTTTTLECTTHNPTKNRFSHVPTCICQFVSNMLKLGRCLNRQVTVLGCASGLSFELCVCCKSLRPKTDNFFFARFSNQTSHLILKWKITMLNLFCCIIHKLEHFHPFSKAQWEFQDPKMEVLYHISGHILAGYSLTWA